MPGAPNALDAEARGSRGQWLLIRLAPVNPIVRQANMKHQFDVRDMCQTASGGSYVVKYSAESSTSSGMGEVTINVANTIPDLVDHELMNLSVDQIRIGVAEVLRDQGLNGTLTLRDLVIHDVDCKPHKFRRPTVDAVRRLGPLN